MNTIDRLILSEQRVKLVGYSERKHKQLSDQAIESHQRDAAIMSLLSGAKHSANPRHYNTRLTSEYGAL
jgi:hypothetical protein